MKNTLNAYKGLVKPRTYVIPYFGVAVQGCGPSEIVAALDLSERTVIRGIMNNGKPVYRLAERQRDESGLVAFVAIYDPMVVELIVLHENIVTAQASVKRPMGYLLNLTVELDKGELLVEVGNTDQIYIFDYLRKENYSYSSLWADFVKFYCDETHT